jgi:hypothetical protein
MKMGETKVTMRIHGQTGSADIEMLADAGALYTKISPALAFLVSTNPTLWA